MTTPFRALSVFFCLCIVAIVSGCEGASSVGTINGTVLLDGQPLKEGLVKFVPVDGKGQTADGTIKDGKFSVKSSIGEMKVLFSAPKIVGKKKMYDMPDAPSVDEVKELIPDKYNVQTKFKITVKAGKQDENFELTSK